MAKKQNKNESAANSTDTMADMDAEPAQPI